MKAFWMVYGCLWNEEEHDMWIDFYPFFRGDLERGQQLLGQVDHSYPIGNSIALAVYLHQPPQYNMEHPNPFPRLGIPYLGVVRRSEQPNCHYIGEQRPKWKYCKEIRNVEEKTRGCM